jgi:hypothetical protein
VDHREGVVEEAEVAVEEQVNPPTSRLRKGEMLIPPLRDRMTNDEILKQVQDDKFGKIYKIIFLTFLMKNKAVVVVVVLLLLLIGGWAVTQNGKKKIISDEPGVKKETPAVEERKAGGPLSSLKDLLAGGKDQKCTWTFTNEGQTMSGIMLVSGKKFRQEITVNDATTKKETQMFTISDGDNMWTWNSETGGQGFKTKVTESDTTPEANTTPSQGKLDWGAEYEYKCDPWTVNAADLTPPTDIKFVDMEAQLKQLQELQNKFDVTQ